jgi:hypothetical protein
VPTIGVLRYSEEIVIGWLVGRRHDTLEVGASKPQVGFSLASRTTRATVTEKAGARRGGRDG